MDTKATQTPQNSPETASSIVKTEVQGQASSVSAGKHKSKGSSKPKRKLNEDGEVIKSTSGVGPAGSHQKQAEEQGITSNQAKPTTGMDGASTPHTTHSKPFDEPQPDIMPSTLPPLQGMPPPPKEVQESKTVVGPVSENTEMPTKEQFTMEIAEELAKLVLNSSVGKKQKNAKQMVAPYKSWQSVKMIVDNYRLLFHKNDDYCISRMMEDAGFPEGSFTEDEQRDIRKTLHVLMSFVIDEILEAEDEEDPGPSSKKQRTK